MSQQYSAETKAAVMAALLTGQSINQVAKEYNLPRSTVASWRQRAPGVQPVQDTKKSAEIGDLLLQYLKTNLETLRVQAEHFRDKAWLSRQSAESAAVLHGVMTDKAIRLLEALSRNNDVSAGESNAT
jgi:transposase-like protein